MSRQNVLVILGMHRSGTSAMTKVVNILGYDVGEKLLPANKFNAKGYWENIDIVESNEEYLKSLGYSWDDTRLLPDVVNSEDNLHKYKKKIIKIIETQYSNSEYWAIKDPRLCRLILLWDSIWRELNCSPKFIIIFRHPIEVAKSLKNRNDFDKMKSFNCWLVHNLEAEITTRKYDRTFVDFQNLLSDPIETVKKISSNLNIDWPKKLDDKKEMILSFLDENIVNGSADKENTNSLPKIYKVFFDILSQKQYRNNDPQILNSIDKIKDDFKGKYQWPGYQGLLADNEEKKEKIKLLNKKINRYEHENERIRKNNEKLKNELEVIKNTIFAKINNWLENNKIALIVFNTCFNLIKKTKKIGRGMGDEKFSVQLKITDDTTNIISVCHPNWQGVRSVTEAQNPNVLYIPEITKQAHLEKAIKIVEARMPEHLIVNGFFKGWDNFLTVIKNMHKNLNIYYVQHGSFYQMKEINYLPGVMSCIMNLQKKKIIDRIGFAKQGMSDVFNKLGIDAHLVMNRLPSIKKRNYKSWRNNKNIFIPATNHPRKNMYTQVMAALMVEDVDEIHIVGKLDQDFMKNIKLNGKKVFQYVYLDRDTVHQYINQSAIVLYVTISECAPVVPLECLVAGTICLSGANHGLYLDNRYLNNALVVSEEDDSLAIYRAIKNAIANYDKIIRKMEEFVPKYKSSAQDTINEFLIGEVN